MCTVKDNVMASRYAEKCSLYTLVVFLLLTGCHKNIYCRDNSSDHTEIRERCVDCLHWLEQQCTFSVCWTAK